MYGNIKRFECVKLRRMSLAIATASQVRVLRFNHDDLQWGEASICRVQVIKKFGEYLLKIDPKDEGVSSSS